MQLLLMRALILGHARLSSMASVAISWYVYFGVSKNHKWKHIWGFCLKSKVAQFKSTSTFEVANLIRSPRPSKAIQGHPRPLKAKKLQILWVNTHFLHQALIRGRWRLQQPQTWLQSWVSLMCQCFFAHAFFNARFWFLCQNQYWGWLGSRK